MEDIILDNSIETTPQRRRALLPTWIKVFTWIFLIFGILAPFSLIFGIAGYQFNLSLYGLDTMNPITLIGILIMSLSALKGTVAFGLWTEKTWAVNLAIIDAIVGIVICLILTFASPLMTVDEGHVGFSFRIELLILIPYLLKMRKIKPDWMERKTLT